MKRIGALLVLAGALLLGAAPSRATPAAPAIAPAIWADYRTRFIQSDGRLIDTGNHDVSHSEGQGYAMLLAAAADDSITFSRVWGWTAKELYTRPDGLASWRWDPTTTPHVKDPNNATDGDLLIAWALARAARQWHSPEYRVAARRIALAVGQHAVGKSAFGPSLAPGVFGFGSKDRPDGPVVNLSYWVFPAFPDLRDIAPEVDWAALTASGLAILEASRFGPAALPSDWISIDGAATPAKSFQPVFGYDAVRLPLYLSWAGLDRDGALARFAALGRDGRPPILDVRSGLTTGTFQDPGYAAVFALAACASGQSHAAMPDPIGSRQPYYPASLHLFALLAVKERMLDCARS